MTDSVSVIGNALAYPIAIAIVALLVSNKHVRNWARKNKYLKKEFEEIDAVERLQKSAPKKYDGEQSFELEIYMSRWFMLFLSAVIAGMGGFLSWGFLGKLMSDLNSSSSLSFDKLAPALESLEWIAIALGLLGFAIWILYSTFSYPTSLQVTPEVFFIKRWRPCSSPTIHLNQVRQVLLKRRYAPAEYGGGKIVNKITFIMRDEKKYIIPMSNFLPTSIEKLVQFLHHSTVKDKIVSSK